MPQTYRIHSNNLACFNRHPKHTVCIPITLPAWTDALSPQSSQSWPTCICARIQKITIMCFIYTGIFIQHYTVVDGNAARCLSISSWNICSSSSQILCMSKHTHLMTCSHTWGDYLSRYSPQRPINSIFQHHLVNTRFLGKMSMKCRLHGSPYRTTNWMSQVDWLNKIMSMLSFTCISVS